MQHDPQRSEPSAWSASHNASASKLPGQAELEVVRTSLVRPGAVQFAGGAAEAVAASSVPPTAACGGGPVASPLAEHDAEPELPCIQAEAAAVLSDCSHDLSGSTASSGGAPLAPPESVPRAAVLLLAAAPQAMPQQASIVAVDVVPPMQEDRCKPAAQDGSLAVTPSQQQADPWQTKAAAVPESESAVVAVGEQNGSREEQQQGMCADWEKHGQELEQSQLADEHGPMACTRGQVDAVLPAIISLQPVDPMPSSANEALSTEPTAAAATAAADAVVKAPPTMHQDHSSVVPLSVQSAQDAAGPPSSDLQLEDEQTLPVQPLDEQPSSIEGQHPAGSEQQQWDGHQTGLAPTADPSNSATEPLLVPDTIHRGSSSPTPASSAPGAACAATTVKEQQELASEPVSRHEQQEADAVGDATATGTKQQQQLMLVPALPLPPLATFPVQHLQAVLGSGLNNMCHRLQTAAQRESVLRLETEMAAVEREVLVQARAFAEAGLTAERTARLVAEQELRLLVEEMEEEQQHWEEQVSEGQGQLKAAHSALRALESKAASLQAELQAEQERRQAAEQRLHQLRGQHQQLLDQNEHQCEQMRQECEQLRAKLEQERRQQHVAQGQDEPGREGTVPSAIYDSSGAASGAAAEAVLLRHMLHLQEEVAALKVGAQRAQQAVSPAPPSATHLPQPVPAAAVWPQAPVQPDSPTRQLPSTFIMPGAQTAAVWTMQPTEQCAGPDEGQQCMNAQPQLPSLFGRQPSQRQGPANSPSRAPNQAQPLLAEVHGWLQHQQTQSHHRGEQDALLEAVLCAAAAGASHTPRDPALKALAACVGWYTSKEQPTGAPPFGGPPAQQQQQQQQSPSPPRRPLHEPRQLVVVRPGSAKRRQAQSPSPGRWDYRPAWNEGGGRALRVDDLPASAVAKARQATAPDSGPRKMASSCLPAAAHLAAPSQPLQLQQIQQQQQPLPPAAYQQLLPPADDGGAASQKAWSSGVPSDWLLVQAQAHGTVPVSAGQPGPGYSAAGPCPILPAMMATGGGSPAPGMPIINQYFAAGYQASPAPPPASFPQQQVSYGAAGEPHTRPGTACSFVQLSQAVPQAQARLPPLYLPMQQQFASQPSHGQQMGRWPFSDQQHFGQYQQQYSEQCQQQQQRPTTPGIALGLGGLRYAGAAATTAASEAWLPHTTVASSRPRIAAGKDKPLAVPPNHIDAGALEAARAEYVREKDRIRAKRLRELQESADFRLQ